MLISVMEADGTDNFSDGFILGAELMNEILQKQ